MLLRKLSWPVVAALATVITMATIIFVNAPSMRLLLPTDGRSTLRSLYTHSAKLYTGIHEAYFSQESTRAAIAPPLGFDFPTGGDISEIPLGNRTAMVIPVNNYPIELPSWSRVTDQPSVRFDLTIILDKMSQRLLMVQAIPHASVPKPDFTPCFSQGLVVSDGYVAKLPEDSPAISLLGALDKAIGSDPVNARLVIATYQLMSLHGDPKEIPVWSIWGEGVRSIRGNSGEPNDGLTCQRTVIDAMTGKPLFIDNAPVPRFESPYTQSTGLLSPVAKSDESLR